MIIESVSDLRQFNVFIFKKMNSLETNPKKRSTLIDAIFKRACKEFHMEIIGYEAVLLVSNWYCIWYCCCVSSIFWKKCGNKHFKLLSRQSICLVQNHTVVRSVPVPYILSSAMQYLFKRQKGLQVNRSQDHGL